jgi:uracil-DNA glycosylase family 4
VADLDRDSIRRALAAHLDFYRDLGVEGWRRDEVWGRRASDDSAHEPRPSEAGAGGREPEAERRGSIEPQTAVAMTSDPLIVTPTEIANDPAGVLDALRLEIGPACTRCKLHKLGRKQVVFGVGNPHAQLMFAGEAPGRDEDEQGEPFVGRAGQLLTKIIEAMGYARSDVYIANVIKCRPPENRNPEPDEVAMCQPFLFRQIDTIKPKVIVALGTFAAQSLLQSKDSISKLRGRVWHCRGARLVPTFHPAFLLRSPERKRDTWEDMKVVMGLLRGEDE